MFKKRISVEQVEEGKELCPKFDENGLIPVITTDYKSGKILMHGFMNEENPMGAFDEGLAAELWPQVIGFLESKLS